MTEAVRFVKFLGFSISAGVIELGSFALFNEVFHPAQPEPEPEPENENEPEGE
jgi:hypothetical protein